MRSLLIRALLAIGLGLGSAAQADVVYRVQSSVPSLGVFDGTLTVSDFITGNQDFNISAFDVILNTFGVHTINFRNIANFDVISIYWGNLQWYSPNFTDPAFSTFGTYETHGTALQPTTILTVSELVVNETPEPASLALVGLGLAGLAGLRRRQRA